MVASLLRYHAGITDWHVELFVQYDQYGLQVLRMWELVSSWWILRRYVRHQWIDEAGIWQDSSYVGGGIFDFWVGGEIPLFSARKYEHGIVGTFSIPNAPVAWHYVQYVVRHLGSKDQWIFWYCPWQRTYLVQEGKDKWLHPVSHYVMRLGSVRYYFIMYCIELRRYLQGRRTRSKL